MIRWTIEYDNDTGMHDEYFVEWWMLCFDGENVAKVKNVEIAEHICAELNRLGVTPIVTNVAHA